MMIDGWELLPLYSGEENFEIHRIQKNLISSKRFKLTMAFIVQLPSRLPHHFVVELMSTKDPLSYRRNLLL